MELRLPPEIKDTPLGQRVAETYSLSDMINQRMTELSKFFKENRLGDWKDWNEQANGMRQVMSLMNEVAKLLIGWGDAQMQWCDEQVKKYKDSYESVLRDNSRLRKENNDLKETNVKLATNITNNTSDSGDEVRVDKENSEILREILARVKNTEQMTSEICSQRVEVRNAKKYSRFEDRLELFDRVGEELFKEELRNAGYAESSIEKYIREIKKTRVT